MRKAARAGGGWWDPGRPVRAASYGMIWPVVALASVSGTAGGVIPTIPLLHRISIALDADLIVEIAPHAA